MKKIAAIFDMDGTLIDNNIFHFEAFRELFKMHGFAELTPALYYEKLSGVPGLEGLKNLLGSRVSDDQLKVLFAEKTENYKRAYAPYIKPINGVEEFLKELKQKGIGTALATSASTGNVDFVFSHLNLRHYFDVIIDNSRLTKGKPDPEIFFNAARDLNTDAKNCVVFEDSISGVMAANNAGMKVIALTTTHHAGELKPVDMLINDYANISADKITALFN